jgi:hypothetical protein
MSTNIEIVRAHHAASAQGDIGGMMANVSLTDTLLDHQAMG